MSTSKQSDLFFEDVIQQFEQAMRDIGLACPAEIIPDGEIHRFEVDGDKPGSSNGWYFLHLGEDCFGQFGSWKDECGWRHWSLIKDEDLSPDKKHERISRLKELNDKRKIEKNKKQKEAAQECEEIWQKANPAADQHPYLVKKCILPHGARLYKGRLVVPARDQYDQITSLQYIDGKGFKQFHPGGRLKGSFY